jgi:hypothetical protein
MEEKFNYSDYILDDIESDIPAQILEESINPRECEICGIDICLAPKDHVMCGECYYVIHISNQQEGSLGLEKLRINNDTTENQQTVSILCCKCSQLFDVKESEKWKTTCRNCYFLRKCEKCKSDISELPSYKQLCDNCYQLQLITKTCHKCGRSFSIPRSQSYKKLCSRSDCVEITSEQQEKIQKTLTKNGYSQKEISWLESIAQTEGIQIQHKGNGNQYIIITKMGPKKVDGYCYKNNTVYEFYGEYYHGHPTKSGIGVNGKTYKELYQRTLEREELIKEVGYTIVSMLEEDYDKK